MSAVTRKPSDVLREADHKWRAAGSPVWVGGVDGVKVVRDTTSPLATTHPSVTISSKYGGTSITVPVADFAALIARTKAGDLDHLLAPQGATP